jgi:hypothetical protein
LGRWARQGGNARLQADEGLCDVRLSDDGRSQPTPHPDQTDHEWLFSVKVCAHMKDSSSPLKACCSGKNGRFRAPSGAAHEAVRQAVKH